MFKKYVAFISDKLGFGFNTKDPGIIVETGNSKCSKITFKNNGYTFYTEKFKEVPSCNDNDIIFGNREKSFFQQPTHGFWHTEVSSGKTEDLPTNLLPHYHFFSKNDKEPNFETIKCWINERTELTLQQRDRVIKQFEEYRTSSNYRNRHTAEDEHNRLLECYSNSVYSSFINSFLDLFLGKLLDYYGFSEKNISWLKFSVQVVVMASFSSSWVGLGSNLILKPLLENIFSQYNIDSTLSTFITNTLCSTLLGLNNLNYAREIFYCASGSLIGNTFGTLFASGLTSFIPDNKKTTEENSAMQNSRNL